MLLRLVQGIDTGLEEGVLDLIVLFLLHLDLLSRLVVSELASLAENCDVCWWVDLLKHHFELI